MTTNEEFKQWIKSDNVIKIRKDQYKEQTTQYRKTFTRKALKKYFIKEFINS